jgi:hypothetical protein
MIYRNMSIRSHIVAGASGGIVVLLLMLVVVFHLKLFNYEPIRIMNSAKLPVMHCAQLDSIACLKIGTLQDMEAKGVLLTPQEYTSRIADYYNTLITFLIGLFVLFTIISVYGIRLTSKREIEDIRESVKKDIMQSLSTELKDSRAFNDDIINGLLSRVEDTLVTRSDKDDIDSKVENMNRKLSEMEERINLLSNEVDSKSEIQ